MKNKKPVLIFTVIFLHLTFMAGNACFCSTPETAFEKGIALFEAGQFSDAYTSFLEAIDKDPGNLELNFYLGRAAYKIKDYETAVMAYERILMISPDADRVKLEIAKAYQKLGANDLARQYCNKVLAGNPPEQVKKNIKKFLALIDKSEQEHFLTGQLSTGIGWDSNVWTSPSLDFISTVLGNFPLTGPSSQEIQDWNLSTSLGISHVYKNRHSDVYWKTRGILYKSAYDKTQDLNITYAGLESGPGIAVGKNRYELFFLLNTMELGDIEYLDRYGLKAVFDHAVNSNFIMGTSANYEKKNFNSTPQKDADNMSVSLSSKINFKKNQFLVNVNAEKEKAFSKYYDFKRYSSGITYRRQLPLALIGSVFYTGQYLEYDETNYLFNEKRRDKQHAFGIGLEKKIWQSASDPNRSVSCNAVYKQIQNDSNIDLYEYEKDIFNLSIIYKF